MDVRGLSCLINDLSKNSISCCCWLLCEWTDLKHLSDTTSLRRVGLFFVCFSLQEGNLSCNMHRLKNKKLWRRDWETFLVFLVFSEWPSEPMRLNNWTWDLNMQSLNLCSIMGTNTGVLTELLYLWLTEFYDDRRKQMTRVCLPLLNLLFTTSPTEFSTSLLSRNTLQLKSMKCTHFSFIHPD